MEHGDLTTANPNHTDPHDHGHEMKMYFHATEHATILFQEWHTMTAGEMVGSCFAVFFLAILYEGFKVMRELLLKRSSLRLRNNTLEITSSKTQLTQQTYNTGELGMMSGMHILQSFLHIVQVVISYFLMLIFMTYNVYLCTAVALGAGLGYFLFSWKRAVVVDVNEHCH